MFASEVADEIGSVLAGFVTEAEGRGVVPVEEDDTLESARDLREQGRLRGHQLGEPLPVGDEYLASLHPGGESLSGFLADLIDRDEFLPLLPRRLDDGLGERVFRIDLDTGDEPQHLAGIDSGSIALVPASLEEQVIATFTAAARSSGDSLDGVYQVNAVVPYGLPAGNYAIRVSVTDGALSTSVFSSVAGSGDQPLPPLSDSQIIITGTSGYPAWANSQVFPSGQVDAVQDADRDGLSNLEEYAFNLNPSVSDIAVIPATGVASVGLPRLSIVDSGSGNVLRIEFIRRKASTNSGLTYTAQFGSGLTESGPGIWADATDTPIVTNVDSTWERVTIDDSVPNADRRFGRIKLDYVQP